jgi:hypothetical protein
MKTKTTALLLALIVALTACNSSQDAGAPDDTTTVPDTSTSADTSDTAEDTTTHSDTTTLHETTFVHDCDCPLCEPLPETAEDPFDAYLQCVMRNLPLFANVNDIDLYHLIMYYNGVNRFCHALDPDVQQRRIYTDDEATELFGFPFMTTYGVSVTLFENWVKDHIDPAFDIEKHDYKKCTIPESWDSDGGLWARTWDEDRQMLVYFGNHMCGAPYAVSFKVDVLETRQVGDDKHIYAIRFFGWEGTLGNVETVRAVVTQNYGGGYSIKSMQPATHAATPAWATEYVALRNKLMNDPAAAYKYVTEQLGDTRVCDPEWCTITTRTICDWCLTGAITCALMAEFNEQYMALFDD